MITSAHSHTVQRYGAALALALTGLAGQTAHADNLNRILGGGLGAMAGAFIGQSVGGRDGALIGAAVGGVAGVSIASQGARRQEPVHAPAYAPVHRAPVYTAPVVVAPAYRYREVERVRYYYPAHGYSHRSWGEQGRLSGRGPGDRPWGARDAYRYNAHGGDQGGYHDNNRGGEGRGWDRRD